ncbi:hypothetical protein QOZ84_02445 [Romboutsia sedimentorum]|uniref:Uncharacterized protein n=1 Tax=Romboutsia sedimentorum TaxID=1368474 RepID=A0ABT7E640_9FIRM|nr:hypothetical protein [Romboutsia sedimentorum]MDK2562394.1 hypothetical protein [Romboutsia sedimentorum]
MEKIKKILLGAIYGILTLGSLSIIASAFLLITSQEISIQNRFLTVVSNAESATVRASVILISIFALVGSVLNFLDTKKSNSSI